MYDFTCHILKTSRSRAVLNTRLENTGSEGDAGATLSIRGWGMGRAKKGARPLWLLEMSVWVQSFFFFSSPIPHKENAVFTLSRTLVWFHSCEEGQV